MILCPLCQAQNRQRRVEVLAPSAPDVTAALVLEEAVMAALMVVMVAVELVAKVVRTVVCVEGTIKPSHCQK